MQNTKNTQKNNKIEHKLIKLFIIGDNIFLLSEF